MAERDESSWASAADLAGRIRRRELSPVELMTSTIQRIERRNKSLNAFVFTDFDQAMDRARAAEAAVTSGNTLGPAYMSALLQPFPAARLVPTGGITAANAGAYLKAGAAAVAMGSSLFPRTRIAADGPRVVAPLVAEALAAVR